MPVVTQDGHRIRYESLPGLVPVVGNIVLAHGITADMNEHNGLFTRAAGRFAAAGMNTVRFDYRGHGESSIPQADATIAGELLDLTAVIEFTETIADAPLVLLGCSFGALTVIRAARRPAARPVSALVLWNPVVDVRRTFVDPGTVWSRTAFNADTPTHLARDGYVKLDDFHIGRALADEMSAPRLSDATLTDLSELDVPTLAFHGTADELVPHEYTAAAASGNPSVELRSLAGAGHGFTAQQDQVIEETTQWLTEKLTPPD